MTKEEIRNIIKEEVKKIVSEQIREVLKFIQGNALLLNGRIDSLSQVSNGHLYMIVTNTSLIEKSPWYSKRKQKNAEKRALKKMDKMATEIKKEAEKREAELKAKKTEEEENKETIIHKGWIPPLPK